MQKQNNTEWNAGNTESVQKGRIGGGVELDIMHDFITRFIVGNKMILVFIIVTYMDANC